MCSGSRALHSGAPQHVASITCDAGLGAPTDLSREQGAARRKTRVHALRLNSRRGKGVVAAAIATRPTGRFRAATTMRQTQHPRSSLHRLQCHRRRLTSRCLALDIMDAMGIRYASWAGRPPAVASCRFGAGDLGTAGRIAYRAIDRLAAAGARALSWCPTCACSSASWPLDEDRDTRLDMRPFVLFLAERLDALRPLLRHEVGSEWDSPGIPGNAGIAEAAKSRPSCERYRGWISSIFARPQGDWSHVAIS